MLSKDHLQCTVCLDYFNGLQVHSAHSGIQFYMIDALNLQRKKRLLKTVVQRSVLYTI